MDFCQRQPVQQLMQTDFIIIGSGIAGLYTAIRLADYGRVTVLSKQDLISGNTWFAQGGIAAAFSSEDSPALHLEDTWEAGASFGDRQAIAALVEEAPARINDLLAMGIEFDRRNGLFDLGQEGAHSRKRILHIGGDATGRELVEALLNRAKGKGIFFIEGAFATRLLVMENGCRGVAYLKDNCPCYLYAGAVILATGGCGQLFQYTTNAPAVTGDGLVMAYRAGAVLRDLEFFQFHPTVFLSEQGSPFLISEAVRGEGACLINFRGERFMERYDLRGDLGPRDIVSRGILAEQKATGHDVFLDLRHLGAAFVRERFPTINSRCLEWGLDITSQPIPVSPAAHYLIGGVQVDLEGRTTVPNLFAVGEVASTGVHGANRLASNSLLEGLVFGHRVVEAAAAAAGGSLSGAPLRDENCLEEAPPEVERCCLKMRPYLQEIMWEGVGLLRYEEGLLRVRRRLHEWRHLLGWRFSRPEPCEAQNMLLLAGLMTGAALMRKESRGCHFREDYPEPDAAFARKHFTFQGGAL